MVVAVEEPQVLLTEEMYATLVTLATTHNGSHEYDFGYVQPHRGYARLEPTGLLTIELIDPPSPRWRIATVTPAGWDYVSSTIRRRKRRRRNG